MLMEYYNLGKGKITLDKIHWKILLEAALNLVWMSLKENRDLEPML